MYKLMMKILGIAPESIPDGAEPSIQFTNAPHSWQVFLLILAMLFAVGLTVFLYRREMGREKPFWRFSLIILRVGILLFFLLLLLGPAIAVNIRQMVYPQILVLADDSLSMSMVDRYRDPKTLEAVKAFTGKNEAELRKNAPTRIDLTNELLSRDDNAFIKGLSTKGRVLVMSFSDELLLRKSMGAEDPEELMATNGLQVGGPAPPLKARGASTVLGRAVREAIQSTGGDRVSGIVMLTDGGDTSGEDPNRLAENLRKKGIPVYVVPVGDPSEPRNLRISEVWAPESVPKEDPFHIQTQVQVRNIDRSSIDVVLQKQTDGGAVEEVETKTVDLVKDQKVYDVSFTIKPKAAATITYTVSTPVLEDEFLDSDNKRQAIVKVVDQKTRVLIVSGAPSWDYRMLRNLLVRDKTVDASCWLQSNRPTVKQDGNTVIDELPKTAEKLFKYDAIIFMDPDPADFTLEWVKMLKTFVGKHGGGMYWQCGVKNTSPLLQSAGGQELSKIWPVTLPSTFENTDFRATWTRMWPLNVMPSGKDHPMLLLDQNPETNAKLWKQMPGVYWAFKNTGNKPSTRVLLAHSAPEYNTGDDSLPLLVTSRYGSGSVIFQSFGDTWRWRQASEGIFDRYWIQAVRLLIRGRQLKGQGRGRLMTDRDRYGSGDRVHVTARLYDERYEPYTTDRVAGTLKAGEVEAKIELMPVKGQEGSYEATIVARHLGINEISVTLAGVDDLSSTLTRRFNVDVPNVEFSTPQLNHTFLSQLALQSGGMMMPLDKANKIAAEMPDRRETLMIRGKPITLWDNSRVLILLVVLLGVEWILRKRFHLI